MSRRDGTRTCTLLRCMVLLGVMIGKMLGRAVKVEFRETVVFTVLQRVVALPVVLLVVFGTAMDHGTEALEEVTMHHTFLAVVFDCHAVDGTGDTLCLTLLTLL